MQGACVGDIGVNAFFEAQLSAATQIVALPVTGTVRAFTPVFLHVSAVYQHLGGGAFVEAGEVAAQHQKVCAHGKSQSHMVIVDDTAVGANGHINAGLLEVFVTGSRHFDQCGSLSAANALGLTGDADRTAANADLNEVRAGLGQETEAVLVNNVTGTDLYGVAVGFPNPFDGLFLPAGVAFGGVDDQNVNTGFQQSGNSLGVVTGVDARADKVALLGVQQFLRIGLVGGVVLAEYEVHQMIVLVHDGQGVQLVLPNDIVGFL